MNTTRLLNNRKLILLHPTKTGGTSIKNSTGALTKGHLPLNSWVFPVNCIIITTVRNPYDRVLSMYNHFGYTMKPNFKELLELCLTSTAAIFLPQHKYLHKDSNVIKLESIEQDFKEFCNKYGVNYTLSKDNVTGVINKKKLNKKEKEAIYKRYKADFDLFNYSK